MKAAEEPPRQAAHRHGMMDDNVHVQNSVQLVDALQRAGKDFEMMFYPQARARHRRPALPEAAAGVHPPHDGREVGLMWSL